MTLILSWVAMDEKKQGKSPASLYLASDSRVTYFCPNNTKRVDDEKQKIFLSSKYSEMFALCGDYDTCSVMLKHLLKQLDEEKIILDKVNISEKMQQLKKYFLGGSKKIKCDSAILYGTKANKQLVLYRFDIKKGEVCFTKQDLGETSNILLYDGSGKFDFKELKLKYYHDVKSFNEADTSRGAFRCIYDAISKVNDPCVGGKMQAAVLYRGINIPKPLAIYYGEDCYLFGKKSNDILDKNVEYRNENFEIVNPITGKIAKGAQRQPFAQR